MNYQITNRVVMVRPDHFAFNPQTAASNDWQHIPKNEIAARDRALSEFENMVKKLRQEGVDVVALSSNIDTIAPDAVFPNNWFTTHEIKKHEDIIKLVIYPMHTTSRRAERQFYHLCRELRKIGINNFEILDLSDEENRGEILEGTGSLVLDRKNKIAYAVEAARTTKKLFNKWCDLMGYEGVLFHAVAKKTTGNAIYHTNMAMSIGEEFAVLCSHAIVSDRDRQLVIKKLEKDHEIIEISIDQMNKFAGNIIQLKSKNGDPKIVMSQTAFDAFTDLQRKTLEKYGKLVVVSISTIENVGGGSARCMIAEIFPPR